MQSMRNSASIPFDVDAAFRDRLSNLTIKGAPLTSITAPVGGVTVDVSARSSVNEIIDRLESLLLVLPN
jgi:hypothetical protein